MFIKGATIPLIFVCLGGSIILFSTLACCCTAKGKVPLLYMVSIIQAIFIFILSTYRLIVDIFICETYFKYKIFIEILDE